METTSDHNNNNNHKPHFILIPWMAQGHFIPMIDIARLLSLHSVFVTVITTPGNTSRISSTISRLLPVHFTTLSFPSTATGLPPGCENLDSVPSRDLARNFYNAAKLLRQPLEHHLVPPPLHQAASSPALASLGFTPSPKNSTFQDSSFKASPASLFSAITTLAFSNPMRLFPLLSNLFFYLISQQQQQQQQLMITKSELPKFFDKSSEFYDIYKELQEGENSADGIIVNSFDELEPEYAEFLAKATKKRVWTVGPVSLSSEDKLDVSERGNKADINEEDCLHWLNTQVPGSVIYVSFGSMGKLAPEQVKELGFGLEETKRPFIWVMKDVGKFRKRNEGKCFLIRGWAPQVMILKHKAVGGFLTHCGWNSTLEGVAAGVPLMTWPLGADQFLNEKLVVEVLGVGVRVGAKAVVSMEGGEKGTSGDQVVRREMVVKAVERLMDDGDEEGKKRRERVKELEEKAKRALMIGGSSWLNLDLLIGYVSEHDVVKLHG
ncbi:LOW QUALITY PROTEIN: UDP-glycosyltransferase 73C4-like [Dioscorea cayenensis subsp. rotundata]|uniref:Glycosyltransferase n=1 Tax=Dioscorea cayennensis subsp. rotundata TaxID=55577 RepID=A0AB40AR96_DIOCR|nr:LOW QUALITY PROTEIN: UDP-glycosyltransferase 73C4-like [Dioscorea cayenensis subsp. rotundata]